MSSSAILGVICLVVMAANSRATSRVRQLQRTATAQAWGRLHPRLTRRVAWGDHEGPLPIIEGTVIRLSVEKLPSGGVNKPVWLWWSGTGADPQDADRCWQAFLRRFDVEHTFRLSSRLPGTHPGSSQGKLSHFPPMIEQPEPTIWRLELVASRPPGPSAAGRTPRRKCAADVLAGQG
jgi:hypothetical protein